MSASDERKHGWPGGGVRSILRNGAYLLGAGWLATVLRAVYVLFVARALGPQDYGLFSSAQALYLMFVVGSTAGVATYVAREVAAGRGEQRRALWASFAVEGGFLAFGAAAFLLPTLLYYPGNGAQPVFILLALTIVFRGLATWAMQAFIVAEASQYQLSLVSVFRTVEVLAAIAALALGGGLIVIAVIHLACWALEAAAGLWFVHRRIAAWLASAFDWQRLFSFARGFAAVNMAVSAETWLRLAPLALYPYVAADASEVGQFALAWNAVMVIATAVLTVMGAAIPVVSRAHAREDEKDTYYLSFCIRYGILFVTTLWLIGPIIVGHALDQILLVRGYTRFCLWLNLAALAALLALFAPVLRAFGPDATVLMVAAVMTAAIIGKIAYLHRLAGMALLEPALRAAFAASAGLVTVALLAGHAPFLAAGIGLAVLVAGAFQAGALYLQERRFMLKLFPRKNRSAAE